MLFTFNGALDIDPTAHRTAYIYVYPKQTPATRNERYLHVEFGLLLNSSPCPLFCNDGKLNL